MAEFYPEDFVDLLSDDRLKELKPEDRNAAFNVIAQGTYEWLNEDGDATDEDYRKWVTLVDESRKRLNEMETFKEKYVDTAPETIQNAVKSTAGMLAATAADFVPAFNDGVPGANTVRGLAGSAARLTNLAHVWGNAAIPGGPDKALSDGFSQLKADIDEGKFPFGDNEGFAGWMKNQSERMKSLQKEWQRISQVEPNEENLDAFNNANSLENDPNKKMLLMMYVATRDPGYAKQLEDSFKDTEQSQVGRDLKEDIKDSVLAQRFDKIFGEGAAEYVTAVGDVTEMLDAYPLMKGFKIGKLLAAGKMAATSGALLKAGVAEAGSEALTTVADNPYATANEVFYAAYQGAIGGISIAGGIGAISGAARTITSRIGSPDIAVSELEAEDAAKSVDVKVRIGREDAQSTEQQAQTRTDKANERAEQAKEIAAQRIAQAKTAAEKAGKPAYETYEYDKTTPEGVALSAMLDLGKTLREGYITAEKEGLRTDTRVANVRRREKRDNEAVALHRIAVDETASPDARTKALTRLQELFNYDVRRTKRANIQFVESPFKPTEGKTESKAATEATETPTETPAETPAEGATAETPAEVVRKAPDRIYGKAPVPSYIQAKSSKAFQLLLEEEGLNPNDYTLTEPEPDFDPDTGANIGFRMVARSNESIAAEQAEAARKAEEAKKSAIKDTLEVARNVERISQNVTEDIARAEEEIAGLEANIGTIRDDAKRQAATDKINELRDRLSKLYLQESADAVAFEEGDRLAVVESKIADIDASIQGVTDLISEALERRRITERDTALANVPQGFQDVGFEDIADADIAYPLAYEKYLEQREELVRQREALVREKNSLTQPLLSIPEIVNAEFGEGLSNVIAETFSKHIPDLPTAISASVVQSTEKVLKQYPKHSPRAKYPARSVPMAEIQAAIEDEILSTYGSSIMQYWDRIKNAIADLVNNKLKPWFEEQRKKFSSERGSVVFPRNRVSKDLRNDRKRTEKRAKTIAKSVSKRVDPEAHRAKAIYRAINKRFITNSEEILLNGIMKNITDSLALGPRLDNRLEAETALSQLNAIRMLSDQRHFEYLQSLTPEIAGFTLSDFDGDINSVRKFINELVEKEQDDTSMEDSPKRVDAKINFLEAASQVDKITAPEGSPPSVVKMIERLKDYLLNIDPETLDTMSTSMIRRHFVAIDEIINNDNFAYASKIYDDAEFLKAHHDYVADGANRNDFRKFINVLKTSDLNATLYNGAGASKKGTGAIRKLMSGWRGFGINNTVRLDHQFDTELLNALDKAGKVNNDRIGVAAALIQYPTGFTQAQAMEYLAERFEGIRQSFVERVAYGKERRAAEASVKAFEEVTKGIDPSNYDSHLDYVEAILSGLKPNERAFLEWSMDYFDYLKPSMKVVSELVNGKRFVEYDNYTPLVAYNMNLIEDTYQDSLSEAVSERKFIPEPEKTQRSTFARGFYERHGIDPSRQYYNTDFINNISIAARRNHYDISTLNERRKVARMLTDKMSHFRRDLGPANADAIYKHLNGVARADTRVGSERLSEIERWFNKINNAIVAKHLSSLTRVFTESAAAIAHFVGSSNPTEIRALQWAMGEFVDNHESIDKILEEAGAPIKARFRHGGVPEIEVARINPQDLSSFVPPKVLEALAKTNKAMTLPMRIGDTVSRPIFVAHYASELMRQGKIKTFDDLYKMKEVDWTAALKARQLTDTNMSNSVMSEKGSIYWDDKAWKRITKRVLFPFKGHSSTISGNILAAIRDLYNLNSDRKIESMRYIVSSIGQLVAFRWIRTILGAKMAAAMYGLLGNEEDDSDLQKAMAQYFAKKMEPKKIAANMIQDSAGLIAPLNYPLASEIMLGLIDNANATKFEELKKSYEHQEKLVNEIFKGDPDTKAIFAAEKKRVLENAEPVQLSFMPEGVANFGVVGDSLQGLYQEYVWLDKADAQEGDVRNWWVSAMIVADQFGIGQADLSSALRAKRNEEKEAQKLRRERIKQLEELIR